MALKQRTQINAEQQFRKAWNARVKLAEEDYTTYTFSKVIATSVQNNDYHAYQVKHKAMTTRRSLSKFPHGYLVLIGMGLRPDLKFRDNPSLDQPQASEFINIKFARKGRIRYYYPPQTAVPIKLGALLTPVS